MVASSYEQWTVPESDSFLFKAQQNLIYAERARREGRYDIEANRIYFALHQLACELLRQGLMTVNNPGKHATASHPWRIRHGSYDSGIRAAVPVRHVDKTVSGWKGLRVSADYEPEQVCKTEHWKQNVPRLRERAMEVAEAIYVELSKRR